MNEESLERTYLSYRTESFDIPTFILFTCKLPAVLKQKWSLLLRMIYKVYKPSNTSIDKNYVSSLEIKEHVSLL